MAANRFFAVLLIVIGAGVTGLPYVVSGRPTTAELIVTVCLICLGAYLADPPDVGPFVTGILGKIKLPWSRE